MIRKEIDAFITGFNKNTERFIWGLEEHIQDKSEDETVELSEDYIFNEQIEILILSLKHFADKSGINIYVGKIDSK